MTSPPTLDDALLDMVLAELPAEDLTQADLEEVITHTMLGRLSHLLRRAEQTGALSTEGGLRLLSRERLERLRGPEPVNVIRPARWGGRRPDLMAGNTLGEVIALPVPRPSHDDLPPAAG